MASASTAADVTMADASGSERVTPPAEYDLLLLTDATASMSTYLRALNQSLPEIARISALTDAFSRMGVLAYRDYCDKPNIEWSGWYDCRAAAPASGKEVGGGKWKKTPQNAPSGATLTATKESLLNMAGSLRATGGGDWPEATKTGLAKAHEVMRGEDHVTTLIILFTDAPPHMPPTKGTNRELEKSYLTGAGPDTAMFVDWVTACRALAGPSQDENVGTRAKKSQVFAMVRSPLIDTIAPYTFLCTTTGGACLQLDDASTLPAESISQLTMGLLLAWMGVEDKKSAPGTDASAPSANWKQYKDSTAMAALTNEEEEAVEPYLMRRDTKSDENIVKDNVKTTLVTLATLKDVVAGTTARNPRLTDFSKRYRDDVAYRTLVVTHLLDIIRADVAAVTVNPVFGSLWRTVCNDRANEARNELVEAFGAAVAKVTDLEKKARLKTWLEESYDYASEINELVNSVKAEDRFPCVYLDPTLDFAKPKTVSGGDSDDDDDENAANVTAFTRDQLLEIGRSCDPRILRRLGRVLTNLSFCDSAADLPAHISAASSDHADGNGTSLTLLPLALASHTHSRRFWKVLLHLVLPGTMLAARPAAVLAALALRMGVAPLVDAAETEVMAYRKFWNTLEIPETWNAACLGLLLDADEGYRKRRSEQQQQVGVTDKNNANDGDGLLLATDRALFTSLIDYRLLEANLDTSLPVRVGWKPEKTRSAIGPLVRCSVCKYIRSVSVMAAGGVCGLCVTPEEDEKLWRGGEREYGDRLKYGVREGEQMEVEAAWVQCCVRTCRGQYVVYNDDMLRVRAKCHYCRFATSASVDRQAAPLVECTSCFSRIIWPTEYRPASLDASTYRCPACESAKFPTVLDETITARELTANFEDGTPINGTAWLLRNDHGAIKEPFTGRSVFHLANTCPDLAAFATNVEILPARSLYPLAAGAEPLSLRLKSGMPIHPSSIPALLDTLARWITSRRTERGTCSLCFTSGSKQRASPAATSIRPTACGRKGCHQPVCGDCLTGWYGLNSRGRVINSAALGCPFCRRTPAARVVRAALAGRDSADNTVTLGNLRAAVEDRAWVYAWCVDCGHAKRHMERVCADAGGPQPELRDFVCEECDVAREGRQGSVGNLADGKRVRLCPGCGTATAKSAGCDHITCPVAECGAHWCFGCGEKVDESEIYDHMSTEHGGYYHGGADDSDEDD